MLFPMLTVFGKSQKLFMSTLILLFLDQELV